MSVVAPLLRTFRVAAVRALAVVLCGGCAIPPSVVELGTGDRSFERIEDGEDLSMIEGVQGGWHLWISVRVRGLDPRDARVELEVSPLDTGRPRQTRILALDLVAHDGWYRAIGVPLVMSLPECFQDREALVRATVLDRAGHRDSDERVVVPRWHEPIGECVP